MRKLEEAKEILNALQVSAKQQNNMCCCVLLAMANITENMTWAQATNGWIRIHDVIAFADDNYSITYAENSRETIRKQAMHHFLEMLHLLRTTGRQPTVPIIVIV